MRYSAFLILLLAPLFQVAAADRPNFVLFIADDISQEDLGCYGHPTMKTPRIDALARSGLRFDNAYLTISSCSPSRCSIITGRYPHNTGAPELHTRLPEGQVLFPKILKDSGYYTVLSGKHHMGDNANPAFEKISRGGGPGSEKDWVEILENRPREKPFFCWYASTDAHRTWAFNDEAPRYKEEDVVIPPYLVDTPETREDLTGYYHEVSRFDTWVGRVMDELEKQGVADNTMVVVMADNGRPFPRCKTRLYDSGIKTPFVVHYPAIVRPGVADGLISSIDVSATVLDVADVESDERIQGVSFLPILRDPGAQVRQVVFAEHNWHVYRNHERMVRFGDWLYIRNNFPDQQNLCVEAYMGGAGAALWEAHSDGTLSEAQKNVFRNPCPAEELYRVTQDPHQLSNLAAHTEHLQTLERAREALGNWTTQTGDTVPLNPTPHRDAPPGAPKRDRKKWRRGEIPGASSNAAEIKHPGPLTL